MRLNHSLLLSIAACLAGFLLTAREQKQVMRPSKKASTTQYAWMHPKGVTTAASSLHGTQMGLVETPGVEPLGYKLDEGVKVFRLTAQPIEQTLTESITPHSKLFLAMKTILGIKKTSEQKLKAWGYNGTTPGPTLELTVGDNVRIIFKNELPEPTLLHFHGIEHPHELDRSSDRRPILPGQTHVYEFTVHQPGTFLYHSGCAISKQARFGLAGMIVVHPEEYEEPIDRHIAILAQEWALGPSAKPKVLSDQFNWFTFNGHAAPSIPIITLNEGERVRIHFGSMAYHTYPISLHGHTWTLVGTEGGLIDTSAQIKGATLTLDPYTTRTIEFKAWNQGLWPLYSLNKHYCMTHNKEVPTDLAAHGGMFTLIEVLKKDPAAEWAHPAAGQ